MNSRGPAAGNSLRSFWFFTRVPRVAAHEVQFRTVENASLAICEGYNTYASLPCDLLTSDGVPGTVPGGATESVPRAAGSHPPGTS